MKVFRVPGAFVGRGQILLITLLVLAVSTTIALSLIGRATIDLSMSNQIEESTRAFDAAEAGVEQALKTGSGTTQTLSPGVTYNVLVNAIGGAAGVYQLSHVTRQNTTETIWLAQHDATTGLLDESPYYTSSTAEICWNRETSPDYPAALDVKVLYRESTDGTYKVAHIALDPLSASRNNHFTSVDPAHNGCALGFYGAVVDFTALGITPVSDSLLALRVQPYYADATLAVDAGGSTIPKQGNQIESVGSTGTGVSRKVVVYQQYRAPLSIFDSVIYSQSDFGH